MEAHLLNGVALAYLGDVYYELNIRKYLLNLGITKVNDLHKKSNQIHQWGCTSKSHSKVTRRKRIK